MHGVDTRGPSKQDSRIISIKSGNKVMKPLFFAAAMVTALLLGLSGCAPLVVGGAATGAAVAHDRRTTGTFIEDQSIELKAASALRNDPSINDQAHINITSFNLSVLLTGETPSEAMRARAETVVANVDRVRRVFNELQVAAPSSMMARSSDTVITAKVKTSLFGADGLSGMDATRIKVVTESGTVYLMGLVSRMEADAATERTRQVGGVQRVVKLFEYLD